MKIQNPKKGKIVLLSGPSGVGKGSVWKTFSTKNNLQKYNLKPSISVTTRPKRQNEIEGESYFFVSNTTFSKYKDANLFLENEEYAGNKYGTLKSFVNENIEAGINIFLEIEVQGAKKIIDIFQNDIISIFLLPPSLEELINRINCRNTNTQKDIKNRINIAKLEISDANKFRYNIVNKDLDECVKHFIEILDKNL